MLHSFKAGLLCSKSQGYLGCSFLISKQDLLFPVLKCAPFSFKCIFLGILSHKRTMMRCFEGASQSCRLSFGEFIVLSSAIFFTSSMQCEPGASSSYYYSFSLRLQCYINMCLCLKQIDEHIRSIVGYSNVKVFKGQVTMLSTCFYLCLFYCYDFLLVWESKNRGAMVQSEDFELL